MNLQPHIQFEKFRYVLSSIVLCWRDISKPVWLRFPTVRHLVHAGLMTEEELEIYSNTSIDTKWFLPIDWAQNVVAKQPKMDPSLMYRYIEELRAHRDRLLKLYCYDWVWLNFTLYNWRDWLNLIMMPGVFSTRLHSSSHVGHLHFPANVCHRSTVYRTTGFQSRVCCWHVFPIFHSYASRFLRWLVQSK